MTTRPGRRQGRRATVGNVGAVRVKGRLGALVKLRRRLGSRRNKDGMNGATRTTCTRDRERDTSGTIGFTLLGRGERQAQRRASECMRVVSELAVSINQGVPQLSRRAWAALAQLHPATHEHATGLDWSAYHPSRDQRLRNPVPAEKSVQSLHLHPAAPPQRLRQLVCTRWMPAADKCSSEIQCRSDTRTRRCGSGPVKVHAVLAVLR